MSIVFDLLAHDYQRETVAIGEQVMSGYEGFGALADPGLGKTIMALELFERLRNAGIVKRAILVAPIRVLETGWPKEIANWCYDFDLINLRDGIRGVREEADIYGTSFNRVHEVAEQSCRPWDFLIVDESTKFKNWSARRSVALRSLLPEVKKALILTGTPAPNALLDMYPQIYLLDRGKLLGPNVSAYRARFAHLGRHNKWHFNAGMENEFYKTITPLVWRLDCEDHLDMPELIKTKVEVDLPRDIRRKYKQLERELFTELASGTELLVGSAGAKYSLLRQMANGAVYVHEDNGKRTEPVHRAKLDAVVDLVDEINQWPVCIAYQFQHDLAALKTAFPKAPVTGGVSKARFAEILRDWQAGKIPVLLAQCQSISHGVDGLQKGGHHLIWYGLTDDPDVHTQLIGRWWRQGQRSKHVHVYYVLAKHTVDEMMYLRITDKDAAQKSLLDALKEYGKTRGFEFPEEF